MGQRGDSPKDEGSVYICLRNSSGSNSKSFSGRRTPTTRATGFCGALYMGPWDMGGDWSVASSSYPKLESGSPSSLVLHSYRGQCQMKQLVQRALFIWVPISPYRVTLSGVLLHARWNCWPYPNKATLLMHGFFPGCVGHVLYSRYTVGHFQIRRYACLSMVPKNT